MESRFSLNKMSDQSNDLKAFGVEAGVVDAAAAQHGDVDEKPKVMLPGGNVKIMDTAEALFTIVANSGKWFYRGGHVVIINQAKSDLQPVLEILKPAKARSEFEAYADFYKRTPNGIKADILSEDMAKAIIECSVAKQILPNVKGLINCPIMVLQDKKLHITPLGHDVVTEYYVTGNPVHEAATVERAVGTILGMLRDFDFQTEGDRSRAIASVMTPMLKMGGIISGGVPVEIIEANDSQTGKGYFVLLRCAVYGEKPLYVAARKGGVGSLDESFASALVKGRPFILLDNYRGNLDSQYMESFATAHGHFSVRVPFSGEVYVDPSESFMAVTSNGMQTTKDFANRAVFIRLKKQYRKVFRMFKGQDMLTLVRGDAQPMLLGAVVKIIRHWFDQGMQRTDETGHTFRDWVQINDWIVQNIFHGAPLLEGHDEAQQRLADPSLTFARLLAVTIERRHELKFPFSATTIYELCGDSNIEIPGMKSHDAQYGAQQVGRIMGKLFIDREILELDGYSITRTTETTKTGTNNIQNIKQYTFDKIQEKTA